MSTDIQVKIKEAIQQSIAHHIGEKITPLSIETLKKQIADMLRIIPEQVVYSPELEIITVVLSVSEPIIYDVKL